MKAILLFALITLFVTCPAALARPGDLDSTFGVNGVVRTYFNKPILPFYRRCSIQKDNKILVAGNSIKDLLLIRYTVDGSIDSSFGVNGIIIFEFNSERVDCYDLVLQPNEEILVSGATSSQFFIIRFLQDGKLDTTFNNNGILLTNDYAAYKIIAQDGGKLLLPLNKWYNDTDLKFGVLRLNNNGTIDSTYGINGISNIDLKSNYSTPFTGCKLIDQGTLVGGFTGSDSKRDFLIAKYDSSGKMDTTFGKSGLIIIEQSNYTLASIHNIIQLKDENIICQGVTYYDSLNPRKKNIVMFKISPNGIIDTEFGNNGFCFIRIQEDDELGAIRQNYDAGLLVSGTSSIMGTKFFYLVKYKLDGNLDTSFGYKGFVEILGGNEISIGDMELQNNGKIILGGTNYDEFGQSFILYRFNYNDHTGIVNLINNNAPNISVYPNPVNSNFSFQYTVSKPGIVSLSLYDTQGNKIYDLIKNLYRDSGTYENNFELNSLSIGQYFLLYKTNEIYKLLKLIIE